MATLTDTGNPVADALRETCILASVSCRAFGLTNTDRVASQRVAQDNNAVQGAARVIVSRLPGADSLHRAIINTQITARMALARRSMRYGDEDGWRLLPNAQFEPLMPELGEIKRRFNTQLDELRAKAPDILDQARINAGTLAANVPTVDDLVASYALETAFKPVADPNSFGNLPPATVAKLAKHVETRTRAAFEKGIHDVLERLATPLAAFVDRMQAFDQREALVASLSDNAKPTRAGVFRDTVVTNIREIVQVLDSFNVLGDERLTQMSTMLKELATVKPRDLRSDPELRKTQTEQAQRTLSVLNDWMTPAQRAA